MAVLPSQETSFVFCLSLLAIKHKIKFDIKMHANTTVRTPRQQLLDAIQRNVTRN